MKQLYARMPGPPVVKVVSLIVLLIVLLVLLFVLFEWAGGILDDGGTIGFFAIAKWDVR